MKTSTILFWAARIVAALLLLQTLFFKFTAAPESVEIFTKLGMEPWGRIGTGVMELIASILILVPFTVWLGALLAVGLMAGAVLSHLTVLGVEVQGDGGQLFAYAVIVLICGLFSFWQSRSQLPSFIKKFLPSFLQ
ncbi:MAG: DoxX family protein [Bacteroidetes bacterium]|nr:DoxX family protein [Bacteroidota bacterium]